MNKQTDPSPKPGAFYNLSDPSQGLYRKLMDGISIRAFCGENVMLSIVSLEPHITGRTHHHPEEQWGLMLEGTAVRIQDGREVTVSPGDFWHTPSNLPHAMRTDDEKCVVLDIFGPPREIYATPGEGYGMSPGGDGAE